MNSEVMMARQPISDSKGNTYAYELLYRSPEGEAVESVDEVLASKALVHSLIDIGLEALVGRDLAFINISESLLFSKAILLLPADRVVLEILESTPFTTATRDRIVALRNIGYQFAYDDFTFQRHQWEFLPYMGAVKVDVLATGQVELKKKMPRLRATGVKLIAEKVETAEMFRTCEALGFDYFQGYHLARPVLQHGPEAKSSRVSLLRIVSKLQDQDASISDIERLIEGDVSMAYRLLKIINSAGDSVGWRVESVRSAILIMGIQRVAALASLLLMSSSNEGSPELINTAMIRARMCEELASTLGFELPHKHFTIGLFSVLEAVVGVPMQALLADLPLSEQIVDVLLGRDKSSKFAQTLACAVAYEQGDFAAVDSLAPGAHARNAYLAAVSWSISTQPALAA